MEEDSRYTEKWDALRAQLDQASDEVELNDGFLVLYDNLFATLPLCNPLPSL